MPSQLVSRNDDPQVLRIKTLLEDRRVPPGTRLCDSLVLLHLLKLPEIRKSTNVISVVTCMKESNSRRTRDLACILIRGWRKLTNEWMNENSSESTLVDQLPVNEEDLSFLRSLPFPPPHDMRETLADDDNHEDLQETPDIRNTEAQEDFQNRGKLTTKIRPKERKVDDVKNLAINHPTKNVIPLHGKPVVKKLDDREYEQKLAMSKRKLRDGYQDAENEKKRHRSLLLDFKDLPTTQQRGKKPEERHGCRTNMRPKNAYRPMVW